jgi:amino acid transporter
VDANTNAPRIDPVNPHARLPLYVRSPLFTFFVLLFIFGLTLLNIEFPLVRFTVNILDASFCLLMVSVPWLALIVVRKSSWWKDRRRRWVLILLSLPELLIGALLLMYPLFLRVERMTTLRSGGYQVSVYRVDCGVACSSEMEIRQERMLIPPFMAVRRLSLIDDSDDVLLEIVPPNELRVTALGYDPGHSGKIPRLIELFPLKRFLYF